MSNAYPFRMPAGIAGDVNRAAQGTTIETQVMDPTNFATVYGSPLVIDATTHDARKPTTGDTQATIYGALVRPFPTNSSTNGLGTSTPPTSGPVDVLKRGYIIANITDGSVALAAKAGIVTVDLASGTFSAAAADSTHVLAGPGGAYFTGPADSNGNVEIAFQIN